jgi:iron complex outermembrane receptor protein
VKSIALPALAAALLSSTAAFAADATSIETVIVTGARTTLSLKSTVPTLETPQNIQVLSAALIADQGDLLLDEALRNVAGVMPGGYYNGFDYFRIRGFDAAGFIYLDNLKYDTNVTTNVELFGFDQVEIVKGPAASLYGEGSLGGLVNLVSKRPKPETFATASLAGGSFGSYDVSVDAGMVLNDSGSFYGRVAATHRLDGTYIDYAEGLRRTYVAPSLTWNVDDATTITFLTSYQHDNMNMGMPLPARGFIEPDVNGEIPVSRFVGEPGDSNKLSFSRGSVGYEMHHSFNDWLTVRQNLRYVTTNSRWNCILYPSSLDHDDANARVLSVYPFSLTENVQIFGVDTALEAAFSTGPVAHTLTAGVDYFRDNDSSFYHQIDYSDPAGYIQLDLFHPVYGAAIPAQNNVAQSLTHIGNTGLYVQDHAVWGDFTLTAGVRWDDDNTLSGYGGVNTPQHASAVVPRVGVTYAVTPGVVAYASYSESFQPQAGTLASGGSVEPERGHQWEGGVKLDLWDGKISATASVYQLTRSNVVTSDLAHPGFVTQTGEQQSQGFELDSQAILAEGWQVIAAYSYIDAKVTKDNVYPVGDHPNNVPPQSLSLWTKYTFTDGALKGLGGGIGGSFYSAQWGDLPNTFRLPAYALVNANLSYDLGEYALQINVKNLLDQRYAAGAYNDLYVNPGAPRSVMARISWSY